MLDRKHTVLMLAMAGVFALPSAAGTQEKDVHAGHQHPEMAVTAGEQLQAASPSVQERRLALRQRMQEIRATQDPDKRRQLLEAQMEDMDVLLEAGVCPMAGGGMMAGQGRQGMMGGMMGRGMPNRGMDCGRQPGMGGMGMQGDMGGMACGMGGRGMQLGRGGQGQAGLDDATSRRLEALEKRVDLLQMMLQMQAR